MQKNTKMKGKPLGETSFLPFNKKDHFLSPLINGVFLFLFMLLPPCQAKTFLELTEKQQVESQQLFLTKGHLPKWLKGSYLYIGPAKYHLPKQLIGHWFDGLAMIYKVEFIKGKAYFSNKFICSDVYLDATTQGRLTQAFIEKEITPSLRQPSYPTTNTNIHTALISKRLMALGETRYPVEVDLSNLTTKGPFLLEDDLTAPCPLVHELAHLKKDPQTGNHYNLTTAFGFFTYYQLYKIPADHAQRQIFFKESVSYPSYMHDLSITKNYVILIAPPLMVNPWHLRSINQGYIRYFKWYEEEPTRIYVINRHTGHKVFEGKCDPLFTFHHVNAFEKQGKIILDFIAYRDASILFQIQDISPPPSFLCQLEIDCNNQTVHLHKASLSSSLNIDLPRVNEKNIGQEYQFFYAVDFHDAENKRAIVKINRQDKSLKRWEKPFHFAGEALFVAHPYTEKEDKGVLLSIVYNQLKNESFLLILDASTLQEIAQLKLPFPIPFGLHGNFYAE